MNYVLNMRVRRGALRVILGSLISLSMSVSALARFEPTRSYELLKVEGWAVRVSNDYANHPDKKTLILNELEQQLNAINKTVPRSALSKLKKTVFWVEYQKRPGKGAVYHPSRDWLIKHDYNPDKAGGVELQFNFYLWRKQQPWIALHELSHAYHHKHLGHANKRVLTAFEKARRSNRYNNVEHVNGSTKTAYAMNNKKEYFAELSEAYFGHNDFEPFDRKSLRNFDPIGFRMVQAVWGD
nr:putative metallopeptidase [uncultured bacterium]